MDRNKPMIAVGEQNRFFFPPNLLSTFFKEEKTDEIVGFIEFLPDFYGSPMTHRNKIMRVVRQNVWNGWNSVEIPSTQEFQLSRSRDNGRKKNTSPANTTSQTRAKQTPKRQTNVPGKDGREKKSRDNTRGPGARQAGELKKMSCVASLHCIPAVCAAIERRDIRPCCRRGQQKHKQEPLLSSSRLLSLSLSVSFPGHDETLEIESIADFLLRCSRHCHLLSHDSFAWFLQQRLHWLVANISRFYDATPNHGIFEMDQPFIL